MTMPAAGLLGCGRLLDACGTPLRLGDTDLTGQLLDRAGFRRGETVLDVGCGAGVSAALMWARDLHVVAVDCDATVFAAPPRAGCQRVVARGETLPFADGAFDGVLAECCLSLMSRRHALAEWARVLRPGGRLALADLYTRSDARCGFPSGAALRDDALAAGFLCGEVDDHSDALVRFVARFIFVHGSLAALWGDCRRGEAARKARIGYGLWVATKREAVP